MDVGCYCVSGSRLLGGRAGDRSTAQALVRRRPARTGCSRARCGSRATSSPIFDCGTALADRDELEAIGSEGSLFLDDPWHCVRPVIELRRDDGVERIELEPLDSYRLELENLSDAIRGEAELLLGREDAVAQARTIEALHRSATTGQAVAPDTRQARRSSSGFDSVGMADSRSGRRANTMTAR